MNQDKTVDTSKKHKNRLKSRMGAFEFYLKNFNLYAVTNLKSDFYAPSNTYSLVK